MSIYISIFLVALTRPVQLFPILIQLQIYCHFVGGEMLLQGKVFEARIVC